MEDDEKIKAVRSELNNGKKGPWDDVTGLYMMPQTTQTSPGNFAIDMTHGVTVKLFVNTETGELKSYWIGPLKED